MFAKYLIFRYQRKSLLKTEHSDASHSQLTCVDNALVIVIGRVATLLTMVAL